MNMEQKKINIGLIGLGARGTLLLHDVLLEHEDAVICAVCDVYEDRCEKAAQYIQEKTGQKPFQTTNYKEIFERKEVDAVLLCSSISTWLSKRWSVARQWDARSEEPIPFGNVGGL